MAGSCMALARAITRYIEKADANMADALRKEGYQHPEETVRDISRLEDSLTGALKDETALIARGLKRGNTLGTFATEIWPDITGEDRTDQSVEKIMRELLSTIVPNYANFYIQATDRELRCDSLSKRTTAWIDSWAGQLGQIMKLNSHKEVQQILDNGLREGVGMEEFTRRILDSGIRDERYKARRVAVTEVLTAHRVSAQEAYSQSPCVTEKMWRHTGSYRNTPRPNHIKINGQKVLTDSPFTLVGRDGVTYFPMYPGDTDLPAGERINCHCISQPVVSREILGMPLEDRQRLQQQALDEMDDKWMEELDRQNRERAGIDPSLPGGVVPEDEMQERRRQEQERQRQHDEQREKEKEERRTRREQYVQGLEDQGKTAQPQPPEQSAKEPPPESPEQQNESELARKVQKVRDDIKANGGKVTEDHLHEAGAAVRAEVEVKLARLKTETERLKEEYERMPERKQLEETRQQLRKARSRLNLGFGLSEEEKKALQEKIEELKQESDLLSEKVNKVKEPAEKADRMYHGEDPESNAAELAGILSLVRTIGTGGHDLLSEHLIGHSPMRKIVAKAYSFYPNDWVEKSIQKGKVYTKSSKRGHYDRGELAVDRDGLVTAIHELGHRYEDVIDGIYDAEKNFYERRTAGEKLVWLGKRFARSEKTKKDNFIDPYIGKYYDDGFEVVSMGFEYAFTNPVKLLRDIDYADIIYGILALL